MTKKLLIGLAGVALTLAAQPEQLVRVDLAYAEPGSGPKPNFSPKGTQVSLTDWPAGAALPDGATRPAKTGLVKLGPDDTSWTKILVTTETARSREFCRLYLDRNHNGDFSDDGPPIVAAPYQNEKTKAWWSTFSGAKFSVAYADGATEPYQADFWAVREGEDSPNLIRYSVRSWRSGRFTLDGVDGLAAVMDSNSDAVFDAADMWSALAAAEPDAPKAVLSIKEARQTNRLMFLKRPDGKELVLEFRTLSPDGRALTFALVDRALTKAADRAADDALAAERTRPRATQPFTWVESNFDTAAAQAKQSGRKLLVDFWTSWCGPCHSLDEWVWTDAEVAGILSRDYVGLKLDGDLEKDLVKRFHVEGYPTVIVLDASGNEVKRANYLGSKEMLDMLRK